MGPPGLLLLLVLAGLAAAERGCPPCPPGPGPVAAIVVADVILTLVIAGGAFWLGRAPSKSRPPEPDPAYQELQGRRDLYSEIKR